MPIGVTNKQYYEDIADAIREKNGSNSLYKPDEMAQAILDIESGGGGGGDITDPVEYRKVHRDKGYPYIPLPSEMKDTTGSYYETNDCIYMLYDARGEMANPAFKLTYSNASGVAYKYRAGANYLTPSTQITANRIISFTLDNETYKFVAKSNHPTTCKMRIDKGILRFYENNVMVEQVPITTKATPTNKDLINDLTNTIWGLPTTPTLPNVTGSNSNEYWVNFTSQNQTFDLMQLDSSHIHYINTTTGNDVLAYDSGWTTGYNSISFTGGDDAKLSWLVNWVCAGTLITETSETITVTSAWQDAYLVSQANLTLASSGSTTYLTYYYGDSDYNNYDYVLIKLNGTITEHDINVKEMFDNVEYQRYASGEMLETSGKCASCNILLNDAQYDQIHNNLEYYSFDGTSNTSMRYMFSNCTSLQTMPELDTSKVTDMSYMFSNCTSLQTMPELDTSKVTTIEGMFSSCKSMRKVFLKNISSSLTNMRLTFNNCIALQTIPEFITSNITDLRQIFYQCYALKTIPSLNVNNANMSEAFGSCYLLQKCGIYNATKAFNLSFSTMLQHNELVNILQNLGVVSSATTLTLGSTNLNKLSADEKAIATKKGWTLA